jgi:beta-xylosidase
MSAGEGGRSRGAGLHGALLLGLVVTLTLSAATGAALAASTSPEAHGASSRTAHERTAPGPFTPPPSSDPFTPGIPVSSGEDESDPYLLVADGRYFLYTSGVPGLLNVPVATSTDFESWSPVEDVLPALPAWAAPGYTWAPDVHRLGSTWELYFTAMLRGWSPAAECIGSASGASPQGPFVARATPLICQLGLGGSIDPRVFTDSSGAHWMLWKSDQNIGGAATPTQLWSQPLSADGLTLTGRPSLLMEPDEAWQGTIVEAPQMVEVDHAYWVFYSGNWFNQPGYAIGAARCAGPAGPCADTSTLPLLGSNAQGLGPGEQSVFEDGSGLWLLYSPSRSLAPKPDFPPRPVFIARIGLLPTGPYLASWVPPPSLGLLDGETVWSGTP